MVSKDHGFKRAIITFNQHNHKIYRIWPELESRESPIANSLWTVDSSKYKMLGNMIINNTEQWVIQWDLQDK